MSLDTLVALPAVPAAAATCPCSIWTATTTPTTPAENDPDAVELGLRFRSDTNGFITAIRFYKGTGNGGTHVGSLWNSTGTTRLSTATFTNETATGWQQVTLPTPVAVTAGTTYVAESLDNGFRPTGLIFLSTTATSTDSYLQDYGSSYAPGSATHHLTLYRAASGALVFGAGSIQWAWGLDDDHAEDPSGTSDLAVRQATANLFADMGVQPSTRAADLVA